MLIQVDYNSGEPICHQVVAQIKWMIASGKLQAGEKLPSIRGLAKQLKVNPTTITRIYNELSADEVIILRQGQGAFVSSKGSGVSRSEARRKIREMARRMLSESVRLGLTRADLETILDNEFEKIPGSAE